MENQNLTPEELLESNKKIETRDALYITPEIIEKKPIGIESDIW